MKKQNFTGLFLLVLLISGAVASAIAFPPVRDSLRGMEGGGWLDGSNQKKVEKSYDEAMAHRDASVELWAKAGYTLFGEGRKGVLIGSEGWLFSAEEFAHPEKFQDAIESNLETIRQVKEKLDAAKAALIVVPVPSKARVYSNYLGSYKLPVYWQAQYAKFTFYLDRHNIPYVDILSSFEKAKDKEALYLRTDTHWTPEGARRAAQEIAAKIASSFPYLTLPAKQFRAVPGETKTHEGDLMRYVMAGKDAGEYGIAPDDIRSFTADIKGKQDLFSDDAPQAVLIGTSYSADERWGFEIFLKEAFQADILNRADEGKGPFTVMEDYLESDMFKNNPPHLVIWEIPERYLPIAGDEKS